MSGKSGATVSGVCLPVVAYHSVTFTQASLVIFIPLQEY